MVENNYSTQLAKKAKFPTEAPKGKDSQQKKISPGFEDPVLCGQHIYLC
jgi:hypothetical protein